jgi:hypothetical protein
MGISKSLPHPRERLPTRLKFLQYIYHLFLDFFGPGLSHPPMESLT